MKISINILLCLFSIFGFSQEEENSIYFPQEQLIHPECDAIDDKNACLENILEKQVFAILNEKKNLKIISKSKKDTLSLCYTILVNDEGLLSKKSSNLIIAKEKQFKKIKNGLNKILKNIPKFKVLNRRNSNIKSTHYLGFKYQIQKEDQKTILRLIQNEEDYSGGTIFTIPQFPGCGNEDNLEARQCFNKQVQSHIAKHFRYPIKAQKKGVQGKVSIMFTIQKDGKIGNIRHRGPHPLLDEEAVRIIKLLPQFIPGKKNGKPVRVPFSIPITFKLQ